MAGSSRAMTMKEQKAQRQPEEPAPITPSTKPAISAAISATGRVASITT